ncbi:acetyltransferase [Neisseria leonii]|uniref:acetyltransferase n=1 Tax=Neisseria leonii TaxID=2995413 RepID=UPI00237BFAC7|nr:acetyltransferase [Neisseria sp. 3986]MDD9326440.1 acetyltransferase [Neisseria sp. 3986]
MKLAIIGSGGHAKAVLDAALAAGWQDIVLLDDAPDAPAKLLGFNIVGTTALLGSRIVPQEYAAAVAVGDNRARARLTAQAEAAGFSLPLIRHPSAQVSRFADLSQARGTVLLAGSIVCAGVVLGRGCIVNTAATVDHDCRIGDFVHISPGAHLAGNTAVGRFSWLGIGSTTRQGSRIGTGCIIGASAAVIRDIPDGCTAVGVPAEIIRRTP